MKIKKLEKEIEVLKNELYELHSELIHDPEVYMHRRNDIEYNIACLEEAIELEKTMKPFRNALIGFAIVSCSMFIYAVIYQYLLKP